MAPVLLIRRAFWAGITDRVQHVANLGRRCIRGDACWRVSTGGIEGPLTCMRIGAVLYPAVLLALADGASFLKHANRPSRIVRIAGLRSLVISIEIDSEYDESCGPSFVPAANTRLGFPLSTGQGFSHSRTTVKNASRFSQGRLYRECLNLSLCLRVRPEPHQALVNRAA